MNTQLTISQFGMKCVDCGKKAQAYSVNYGKNYCYDCLKIKYDGLQKKVQKEKA